MLWDKKTGTIVNNESSEIIRMLNSEFNHLIAPEKAKIDLYPEGSRDEIDALNSWVYESVNSTWFCVAAAQARLSSVVDGVYKAGFASTQAAYEAAVIPLFASLDRLEQLLARKNYLVGGSLTEADVRLFVTIVSMLRSLTRRHPVADR